VFEGLAAGHHERKSRAEFEAARDRLFLDMEKSRRQRLVDGGKFYGMTYVVDQLINELEQIESGSLTKDKRRISDPSNSTARNQLFAIESDDAVKRGTNGNLGLEGVEVPVRDGGRGLGATSMSEMTKDYRARLVLENPKWRGNVADFDE
jgi:hypothetical protein